MRRFAIAAVLFFAASGAMLADEATDKANKELEGSYTVKSVENDGKPLPKEFIDMVESVTIKDGTITFKVKGEKDEVEKFKIDPSKKPATIDITRERDGKKDVTPGIYKFEKGELTIATPVGAASEERPKEFKSAKGVTMIVFTKKEK